MAPHARELRSGTKRRCAGIATLLFLANSAIAGTISETEAFGEAHSLGTSFDVQTSGQAPKSNSSSHFASNTFMFDQFDPSLGTLTGIEFTLKSYFDAPLNVTAEGPTTVQGVAANSALDIYARLAFPTGPIGGPLFEKTLNLAASCASNTYYCDGFDPTPNPIFHNATFNINPSDFGGFVGTGTFSPSAWLDLDEYIYLTTGFALATASGAGWWTGDVTVTYTFTENGSVPEPGTLVLIAAGLAGLVGLRRVSPSTR
jgi:hypothetical protein